MVKKFPSPGVTGAEKNKEMKTYRDFDTNNEWTEEEVKELYEQMWELHEVFPTYEEYLEYQLHLGRQKIGGLVEED